MNRDEALEEFIKGLRIAFNNALAYPKDHPYFIKSVEDFKLTIEGLLNFLNPIELNISQDSLFIDGRYWAKPLASVELAKIMHQRKIKRIEIRAGFEANELAGFLSALALSPKDILKSGGLGAILKASSSRNIFAEELDYSSLLNTEGKEGEKDIWRFLFQGAISGRDVGKINECADNFSDGLKNIDPKEIILDQALKEDLVKFLQYLKDNNNEKFLQCSGELLSHLAAASRNISDKDIESLKVLFQSLREKDFTQVLISSLSKERPSDPLIIKLFSRFSEGLEVKEIFKGNPILAKKVKDILIRANSENISLAYRNTLMSFIDEINPPGDFYFDRKELNLNYLFVLLNLFDKENNQSRLKFILARLTKDLKMVFDSKNYEYLVSILKLARIKKDNKDALVQELTAFEDLISKEVEEAILDNDCDSNIISLARLLSKSTKESQYYLSKIFQENKVNSYSLELFFKFFPSHVASFYSQAELKKNDLELLSNIVKAASEMSPNLSLPVLERLYYSSGEIIKIEVLRAMQKVPSLDAQFIFSVLKESIAVRREALKVLYSDKEALKSGVGILLNIRNPWGKNNNLILENMSIIEELGIQESVEYLTFFTKRRLFWHASLKRKAKKILESLKWKKE